MYIIYNIYIYIYVCIYIYIHKRRKGAFLNNCSYISTLYEFSVKRIVKAILMGSNTPQFLV